MNAARKTLMLRFSFSPKCSERCAPNDQPPITTFVQELAREFATPPTTSMLDDIA